MKKRIWTQEEKLKVIAEAKSTGLQPAEVGQAATQLSN